MSKVFFDYSTMARFGGHPTGIPRTVEELASAFERIAPDSLFIAMPENMRCFHHYDRTSRKFGNPVQFSPGDKLFSASAGWSFAHFNAAVASIVANGVAYYQLYYDLIPTLFPYFYKDTLFGRFFRDWTAENMKLCTSAFSISRCTREDILRVCCSNRFTPPVHVIRLGDALPVKTKKSGFISPTVAALSRFVLSVGTLECRKNQITLLNAYRALASRNFELLPTLVLVGRDGWLNNRLIYQAETDPLLKNKVVVLTDVMDSELDYLYRNCLFTLFPALYEGWGLPVAESLKYGKPCVCSDTSSMLEIAPTFTRFANPLNLTQWISHIVELSGNELILNEETKRITECYRPFSWDETALSILNRM